jgi:hypothetical protein
MTTLTTRRAFLCVALLTGCHAHAYYEPALPPPPPPPLAPPPGAPLPPADDESMGSSAPPASSSTPNDEHRAETPTNVEKGAAAAAAPLPPLPTQAPQYAPTSPSVPPSASEWVRSYPEGQWVYHSAYGWIWIPSGATSTGIDGVPYTYLYTPRFGWTWYISPWGWGHYHYGLWVTRPAGWRHIWVAHPRVVIRLGRPRRRH